MPSLQDFIARAKNTRVQGLSDEDHLVHATEMFARYQLFEAFVTNIDLYYTAYADLVGKDIHRNVNAPDMVELKATTLDGFRQLISDASLAILKLD